MLFNAFFKHATVIYEPVFESVLWILSYLLMLLHKERIEFSVVVTCKSKKIA